MSVGDRDVNSGLFRAQRENSTCLCVSVTQVPLVFLPHVCPSQPALVSILQARGDMLNHSTPLLHRHTHLHVPPADSLKRIPPHCTFQSIPAKTRTIYLWGICGEFLQTRKQTASLWKAGLGEAFTVCTGGRVSLYNFSDAELSPPLAGAWPKSLASLFLLSPLNNSSVAVNHPLGPAAKTPSGGPAGGRGGC